MFVRDHRAAVILDKVQRQRRQDGFATLDAQVRARNPFGIAGHQVPESATEHQTGRNDIILMTKDGDRHIGSGQVRKNAQALGQWKVAISRTSAEHAGNPDKDGRKRVLSLSRILPPKSACTETYLLAGVFRDQETATAFLAYLRTRFCRYLLSIRAGTQDITRGCFAFVPAMPTDRIWTDEELYAHFGLDEEEVAHIERLIKEMPG